MGNKLSAKLLFIGLEGSGKTSVLQFLEEGPNGADPKPTTAYDIKEVKWSGVQFSIYDVAGGEKVRDLWKHYYADTDAVIWFVDSTTPDRFEDSKKALMNAAKDVAMKKDIPVFIAATKSDLTGSKSQEEIQDALNLKGILLGHPWVVFKVNSKKGDGIADGFAWLSTEIKAAHKRRKKAAKGKEEH